MKEIYSVYSQNGRWGVSVVSNTIESLSEPAQATVTRVGRTSGMDVYQAETTDSPQWLVIRDDAEPISGAETIQRCNLQGNRSTTLLLMGSEAIIRCSGYKRRSSHIEYFKNGVQERIPDSVLLAMGALPNSDDPEEIPAPPAFSLADLSGAEVG